MYQRNRHCLIVVYTFGNFFRKLFKLRKLFFVKTIAMAGIFLFSEKVDCCFATVPLDLSQLNTKGRTSRSRVSSFSFSKKSQASHRTASA